MRRRKRRKGRRKSRSKERKNSRRNMVSMRRRKKGWTAHDCITFFINI